MSLPQMQVPHQSCEPHVGGVIGGRDRLGADHYGTSQTGLRISSPVNLQRHVEGIPMPRKVAPGKPSLIPGARSMHHPWSAGEPGKQSAVRLRKHDALSSSGTQVSADTPLAETSYGPMRIKSDVEVRKAKLGSCGSDSLCKLMASRPPSSTGTNRTVGSKGGWTSSQNWVGRDCRSPAAYANPMAHQARNHCGESVDSRAQAELHEAKVQHEASQELARQESLHHTRKGVMDRVVMHQPQEIGYRHVGNLAISPRNQPVHLDDFPDIGKHQEKVVSSKGHHHSSKGKEQERAPEKKHKSSGKERGHQSGDSKKSPPLKAQPARPPEWTGLTENTMELLLKLREEEEVRQLRQRAVLRWLNHLPSPPKKYRGIPDAPRDDEGSCTSIDASTDLDSVDDILQTPRDHYTSKTPPHHDKSTSEEFCSPVLQDMQVCTNENEFDVSKGQDSHSDIKLVKKPEFEFVDYSEDDISHSVWKQRVSYNELGTKMGGLGKSREAFDEQYDYELVPTTSDAAFGDRRASELHAIPEMGSTSDAVGDANHDGGSQRPTSTVEETAEVFSNSGSSSDEPIRHPRDPACNWKLALSSIDKWVDAREMAQSAGKKEASLVSEPDLEVAVDAHDNARRQSASMQKRAFEDRMGWCLSDDCDSSRIAVGLQSAEYTKSPRSNSQTPKLSTRSSTLSDECAQKFHMKYSIPEGKAIQNKWAADDDCSELMNSTTDLQSAVGTLPCETVSEVPLPSPRPGTEYRPSGSIVDSASVEEQCWVKPLEHVVPDMVVDAHHPASSGPQATYWLPEFCQNSPMDRSQSTQFHTPRSEPSHWHDNPLSPHYLSKEERCVKHTAGSRRVDRSTSLVSPDALRQYYYGKEPRDKEQMYSGAGMPKLSPRQKLWRHVQQVTRKSRSSRHKNSRRNKKGTESVSRCTRLFTAIVRMCSPRA